jgi:hypothetical protein
VRDPDRGHEEGAPTVTNPAMGERIRETREEGWQGGKTAEPSISSSEATGSNKSIVVPNLYTIPPAISRYKAPR